MSRILTAARFEGSAEATAATAPASPTGLPRLLAALRTMAAVKRQRRALARLDAAALRDIGVSHADARAEAARPVWDVPPGWRL